MTITGERKLSEQQSQPTAQPQVDYAKWAEVLKRQEVERAHDTLEEFYQYVNEASIRSGEACTIMLMFINGGAAVSVLTFAANLPGEYYRTALANTLVWFASGVGLAVAAAAATYFTDFFMAAHASSLLRIWQHGQNGPGTKVHQLLNIIFHFLAVAMEGASLVAFVIGMLGVRNAFDPL
jgi:hypothetical protein